MKLPLLACAALATPAAAFQAPSAPAPATALSMTSTTGDDVTPPQAQSQMSEALPFLRTPAILATPEAKDLAGNFGFDPLNFATNPEQLLNYREAEVKHARLAMLAAAGWPISELADRSLADAFGAAPLLDEADRVPSVLNGGMDRVSPVWWGFCLGMSAAIDLYGVAKSRRDDPEYFPGNLGFDPLSMYPRDERGRARMRLAEIKHGRVAMMGVLGFAVEEYATNKGVVDDTPVFFQPITETVEELLQSATQTM